jgi:hypothetical protein
MQVYGEHIEPFVPKALFMRSGLSATDSRLYAENSTLCKGCHLVSCNKQIYVLLCVLILCGINNYKCHLCHILFITEH